MVDHIGQTLLNFVQKHYKKLSCSLNRMI